MNPEFRLSQPNNYQGTDENISDIYVIKTASISVQCFKNYWRQLSINISRSSTMKKEKLGPREMVQSVRHLPYKDEDLRLGSQHPCKKSGGMVHAYSSKTGR